MGAFICIDLKSFYASVECVERGLDPFKTDLVVADPTRSKSTICLAITPAMKAKGVKNRCRVHEIPPGMKYITAMPRMQLYIDYSAAIYAIYLRFVAPEDIHVYSIDECFIDVTHYLALYKCTPKEMAQKLMDAVINETGITASAGVGTNLYLAKIAMDIVAKHADDHIGYLDEFAFRSKLWTHEPLTDFWMIGGATQRRLARYGICTMGDIARTSIENEDFLYKLFGVDAELMIDHAWGMEPCTMADIKNYRSESHSLSNGQVLMRNYDVEEALVIIREMADNLALSLTEKCLVTDSITIYIAYDHRFCHPGSGGTAKLAAVTSNAAHIIAAADYIYRSVVEPGIGIRRLNICANRVESADYQQYSLFSDPERDSKEMQIQKACLEVKHRYGKNAILRGANLLECSTYRERNEQIGGHRA